MSDCSISVHIWKWAASPECKIPSGTLCDCGAFKYGDRDNMKGKDIAVRNNETPTEYPWYG